MTMLHLPSDHDNNYAAASAAVSAAITPHNATEISTVKCRLFLLQTPVSDPIELSLALSNANHPLSFPIKLVS